MREGRLGDITDYNKRYDYYHQIYGLIQRFHCGECLEVLLDDEWVQTRMEMNPAKENGIL